MNTTIIGCVVLYGLYSLIPKKNEIKKVYYKKLENENKVIKYEYIQFVYDKYITEYPEFKWKLATTNELSNEQWLKRLTYNTPYFFYKAMIGDVESLIKIVGMYENVNILTLKDEQNNNVLDILADHNKNNELISFVKLLKEKYNIENIFKYTDISHLINYYIRGGNSDVALLFKMLIEEDELYIKTILHKLDTIGNDIFKLISDDDLVNIYRLLDKYGYGSDIIKIYNMRKYLLKKYDKKKIIVYLN